MVRMAEDSIQSIDSMKDEYINPEYNDESFNP